MIFACKLHLKKKAPIASLEFILFFKFKKSFASLSTPSSCGQNIKLNGTICKNVKAILENNNSLVYVVTSNELRLHSVCFV